MAAFCFIFAAQRNQFVLLHLPEFPWTSQIPLISHHFSLFIPTEQGARRHHCPASRCGAQPAGTGIDGGHGADSDALRGAETGDLAVEDLRWRYLV